MKYTVFLLQGAQENLREIREYLSRYYPSTPKKFRAEFQKQVAALQEHPYMFEEYTENPRYRKMPVLNYLVFYLVDEENQRVQIYRVLHGARDIRKHLER